MTATLMLDHVRAYAEQVRSHLRDLSPEQVEDLTDGLEADLAEAVGDTPAGAPRIVDAADGEATATSVIDLTRRFGPAAEYAAELRSAAGLAPAGPPLGTTGALSPVALAARARSLGTRAEAALRAAASRENLVSLATALRPLWWVVRGWVWFVLATGALWGLNSYTGPAVERYLPRSPGYWLLLALTVLASINVGRGWGQGGRWSRRAVLALSVVAVLCLPWATTELRRVLDNGGVTVQEVYVEVPVDSGPPDDGVWVDGTAVSNLFVYDADGNPLSGVQVFDDRGRQVRTTFDEGWSEWALPGVSEPWRFTPALDADGRDRWNVYPLLGAPVDAWVLDDDGLPSLVDGKTLRTPPLPFAKAPAVELQGPAGRAEGMIGP